MKVKYSVLALAAVASLAACDDNTASIGIFSDEDAITSTSETFHAWSNTLALPPVVANSSKSYFGLVEDPETDTEVKAEFMAQFHTFENYTLPSSDRLVRDADGHVVADSAEVRLYFTDFYGDGDNPLKLSVYELDPNNVLREDWTYYSNADLSAYIPQGAKPLAQKVFAPQDYTLSDAERTSTSHYANVRILLPTDFATAILDKAVEHPEYFADSWQFMHHVCPGFAFRLESGRGTMLTLDVSSLNIFFQYTGTDTTYVGVARFAATPEVIQTTTFTNSSLASLVSDDQPYTYLKSPAALATEVRLPVDEVFEGHPSDSISRARLVLTRHNSRLQGDYTLGPPETLLMVAKDSLEAFFDNRRVADGVTSFTTPLTSSLNSYAFTNIARMISAMHAAKRSGMAAEGLTAEAWEARHPNWNRAVVLPVVVRTVTNQNTNQVTQVSVTHDFSLTSTRLVGGTQPLDLHVIYSRYK